MLDLERCDSHAVFVIEHSLGKLFGMNAHLLRREVKGPRGLGVSLVCLLDVGHHFLSAFWPPNAERFLSASIRHGQPSCQPEIRNTYGVVGVQMCNEELYSSQGYLQLPDPGRAGPSAMEHKCVRSRFHECARPETLRTRTVRPCTNH